MSVENKITRRDFLKITGAAAAGAAIAGAFAGMDLEKVSQVFEKDLGATGVLRVNIAGQDHYIPVYEE